MTDEQLYTERQEGQTYQQIAPGYCKCGCGQKTNLASCTKKKQGWVKGQPLTYINGHTRKNRKIPTGERNSISEHLWSRVAVSPDTNECWEWIGGLKQGYGHLRHGGRSSPSVAAHRLAYELTYGSFQDDLCVLHKCDNRKCCNPNHLFLGTRLDNNRDKVEKGRQAKGETLGNHKLTEADIFYIRERFAQGGITKTALAKEVGVSQPAISNIVNGKRWGHVK